MTDWRTVAEMAAAWGTDEREVVDALTQTGVLHSRAHATGEGRDRRWSPQAEAIARRHWRAERRPADG